MIDNGTFQGESKCDVTINEAQDNLLMGGQGRTL